MTDPGRILIVEDEAVLGKDLRRRLEASGHQVLEIVAYGEDAVVIAKETVPDLVLIDIKLKGEMDGIEAAGLIKKHLDPAIVYLTAHSARPFFDRAKETEPFAYVSKPVSPTELDRVVEMALFKHRMEKRLRESEERFRKVFEQGPLGMFMASRNGKIEAANARFCEMIGYPEAEITRHTFLGLLHPDDAVDAATHSERLWHRELRSDSVERRLLRKDGGVLWARLTVSVVRDETERPLHFFGMIEDVTDRRNVEQALRASEERYRTLVETMAEAIVVLDRGGRMTYANRPLLEVLGRPEEEVKDRLWAEVTGDSDQLHALIRRSGANPDVPVKGELDLRRRDGTCVPFAVSLRRIRDSRARIHGTLAVLTDMTDRKRAEELVVKTERVNAISDLASGVAHNFNNLLQIMMGGLNLALNDLDTNKTASLKDTMERLLDSVRFGAEIVRRLQTFANLKGELKPTEGAPFDLAEVVRQAVQVSGPHSSAQTPGTDRDLGIHLDLHAPCLVKGRENELFEVIVNLVKNALEAMPRGGDLTARTWVEGDEVICQVCDTGVGIRRENMRRVFQPFWSTKRSSIGAGMGLALCHGVVTRHGGSISVESAEGEGAVFTIRLPRGSEMPDTNPEPTEEPQDVPLTVLIVDDMVTILALLERILTRKGHTVFTAESGTEALKVFQEQPVDVVVCDLIMPDMDGWAVGKAMRAISEGGGTPKVPFMLLTGWGGQDHEHRKIEESGVDAVVKKPIEPKSVLKTIARISRKSR
jgi:two-component system, cell cycle sensor histidine kinase and response regulator CckA